MSVSLSVQGLKSLTSKVFFANHNYFAISLPQSGRPRARGAPACLAVTVLALFLFAPVAGAAVIMESNGAVTSIGVPKGEGRADADLSAPTGEMRDLATYPGLPWGIVPELHIPWPSSPHGGWQRPHYGPGTERPQHGDGWRPSRRPGQRPPQTGIGDRAK